jgi:hypothetical protein
MEAIGRRRWAIPRDISPPKVHIPIATWSRTRPPAFSMPATVTRMWPLLFFSPTGSRLDHIASPSPAGTRCICASMIWMIRGRFRAIPTMPLSSNPTFRSSCNTHGSIPVAPRSRFCRPSLIRKTDSQMANLALYFSSLWRAEVRNFSHRNTLRQERVLVERKI